MKYSLTVNDQSHVLDVPADCSLLEVLRNDLAIKSPKFGCGLGQCGACFVLIDGQPRPSCDLPIEYVGPREVSTLEGIGDMERPHRLQTAFLELQAGQCGYCVSGILVSAAALLLDNPAPTREQVVAALDRHLCRCGSQQRFLDAVLAAADASL